MIVLNNSEYSEALVSKINKLRELREDSKSVAMGVIGNTLYKEDLFFISALDRGVALIDGIIPMLTERNLTCAGILVRSQIDNCMRIYAAFIAENKMDFINGFLNGKKICDFNDNRGKRMKDLVLRQRLKDYDSQIDDIYKKASGYVHLSDEAFYASVTTKSDYKIEITVGIPVREELNKDLLTIADVFTHYTLLQYRLIRPVIESKMRADKETNP